MNLYKLMFAAMATFSLANLEAQGCNCHKHKHASHQVVEKEDAQPTPPGVTVIAKKNQGTDLNDSIIIESDSAPENVIDK